MAKILIVDDSMLQRKFLADALQSLEYDYEQANNGEEALAKLRQNSYDCVTLDLLMPVKDGISVLEGIQQEKLSVPPIIVVTSNIQDSVRQRCLDLGAFDFLNKPFKKDQLAEIINKALQQKTV